ncbi:gram-positive signal peptide, YSIRK family domain protein [Streptococcus sanguinis]|nr:gram-positive signal peptide, YSIRK family domain protein [Streptococcus sanguinis]
MTRCEANMTFLNLTLQSFSLITSTSWSYLGKLWTVGRCHWSTILIHPLNGDWIWFTYKLLVWREGHCAIRSDGISSLTWNILFLAAISEGWLYCVIDWNKWVAACEGRYASLRKALWTCAGCIGTCWSYFSKLWTVSCRHWSAVLVHSLHCDWVRCAYKLLLWRESHYAIWSDGVSSLTWNLLLLTSICKGWLNCFINWN